MLSPYSQLKLVCRTLFLISAAIAVYSAHSDERKTENIPPENLPSLEFLEFLADFDDADDETFELILHHGKEDADLEELENTIGQKAPTDDEQAQAGDEV